MDEKKKKNKKTKKPMSHNKAARKADGTRLRQGLRGLTNKLKKKK
jgi:hypothetical protein|tara:strand:+ start:294 stop:428 length:135 start_codon:yes stop_codon:yes gene_type:complete